MIPFPEEYTEEELQAAKALYAGEVTLVDYWIGRLLDKVDHLGLMDDTLIIFTSDHGTAIGEHGVVGKFPCGYREVNRIPLIIWNPEGPKSKRISNLVWAPDFAPTILDILNVNVNVGMHGKSFWPMVLGEEEKSRDFVVCGTGGRLRFSGKISTPRSVEKMPPKFRNRMISIMARELYLFDGEWSFIYNPTEVSELYNLKNDPKERRNLISDYPEKAEEMKNRIKRYKEDLAK